ncbi:MAG: trehalose-6-phosphate synthase [Gemmatimonadota bacterium]|nr:trehalose-6-phosphate synthase [Gemmatimonadota bacterium]
MPRREPALIAVSNRLPITLRRGARGLERIRSTGGLVAAFDPLLRQRRGIWIGWPGRDLAADEKLTGPGDPYEIEAVSISKADLRGYYNGFSNGTLWPLFHTLPGRSTFETSDWEAYRRVNERFAQVTASKVQPKDLVLINDYQLMLVPNILRRRSKQTPIGFFLHIPFPPYDVFRVLPWSRPLLRGVLGANLVGFHVAGYVRNFLDCARHLLNCRVDHRRGIVHLDGREIRVMALPLGIDFERYESLAQAAPDSGLGPHEHIVLGVDRLDYTKGIPERLKAFARLLNTHPQHRNNVTLVQVAVPSRSEVSEYRDLKRVIDRLVGEINGRFGSETWTPIRYLYRSLSPERLCALYRDADVALVTPLRDGMNLVAKEYVACQVKDPGVLILSHMAGAAETMDEALLVNPYNLEDTAEKLHMALTMSMAERQSRMKALRKREATLNVHTWAHKLVQRLAGAAKHRTSAKRR